MELDSDARRVLELVREVRTPNTEDKQRVARMLSRSIQSTALAGAASTTTTKSGAAAIALKWTLGATLPIALAVAGYMHVQASKTPAPSDAPKQPVSALIAQQKNPLNGPEPHDAAPSALAPTPAVSITPSVQSPVRRKQREQTRASDSLEEELELLHEAQAKWRAQDPNEALSLLALHRQRYPKSTLTPEREALRVLSLCAAGRTKEAKEVARRSFKSGGSALRTSIEQSCITE